MDIDRISKITRWKQWTSPIETSGFLAIDVPSTTLWLQYVQKFLGTFKSYAIPHAVLYLKLHTAPAQSSLTPHFRAS